MEQNSFENILLKVNNLRDLNEKDVIEKIKSQFTLIDHFFKFKVYSYGDSSYTNYEQTLLHFAAKMVMKM